MLLDKRLIFLFFLGGIFLFSLSVNFSCQGCAEPSTSSSVAKVLSGDYTENVTIAADETWELRGRAKFASGTVLTIGAGATIKGNSTLQSYLVIDRGAKIIATGTAAKPIVFTSSKTAGNRANEDWGGIVINGYATINNGAGTPKTAQGEGDSGTYGGDNDADNSGELRYVRIEFAGRIITGEDELNGLGLQGVGTGTVIENIHLHNCSDDGIEMFGGTVNLSNIISTANGDDQIDCTGGWRGNIVNAFVAPIGGNRGLEFDGNSVNNAATPYTMVNVNNIVYLANKDVGESDAFIFREGARVNVTNAYLVGAKGTAIKVTNSQTVVSGVLIEDSEGSVDGTATEENVTKNHAVVTLTSGFTLSDFTDKSTLATGGVSALKKDVPGSVNTDWISDWTEFPEN